jgi:hypothetical protein
MCQIQLSYIPYTLSTLFSFILPSHYFHGFKPPITTSAAFHCTIQDIFRSGISLQIAKYSMKTCNPQNLLSVWHNFPTPPPQATSYGFSLHQLMTCFFPFIKSAENVCSAYINQYSFHYREILVINFKLAHLSKETVPLFTTIKSRNKGAGITRI